MPLQYLSDASGKQTAVVIPLTDWNRLKSKFRGIEQTINAGLSSSKRTKPSDFRGSISKETAKDINHYIDESKKEWENDTF
ncbi:hypothetical protein [Parapedobacter tibetensis]|uniref:hypothetical protein n=1 Tax=Parapedobacter tibetensis TaxID=2972951 RepID=UPI00214D4CC6|nr:hypothetical protein [Parapedobacter tibetensis]